MGYGRDRSLPSPKECSALDAIERGGPLPPGLGAGKLGKLLSVGWITRAGQDFAITSAGRTALRRAQQLASRLTLQERRPQPTKSRAAPEKRVRYKASARAGPLGREPKRPLVASPPWTMNEEQRLRRLADAGKGPSEIAHHLGRSVSAVRNRLYKLRNS